MLNKRYVLDSRGCCTIVARFIPSFAVDQSAQSVFNESGQAQAATVHLPRPEPLRLRGSMNEEVSSSSNGPESYQGFDPKSSQQQEQSSEIAHKVGRYPLAVRIKPHERRTIPYHAATDNRHQSGWTVK